MWPNLTHVLVTNGGHDIQKHMEVNFQHKIYSQEKQENEKINRSPASHPCLSRFLPLSLVLISFLPFSLAPPSLSPSFPSSLWTAQGRVFHCTLARDISYAEQVHLSINLLWYPSSL